LTLLEQFEIEQTKSDNKQHHQSLRKHQLNWRRDKRTQVNQCTHREDGFGCDDGDECTNNDVCVGESCSGGQQTNVPCNTDESCQNLLNENIGQTRIENHDCFQASGTKCFTGQCIFSLKPTGTKCAHGVCSKKGKCTNFAVEKYGHSITSNWNVIWIHAYGITAADCVADLYDIDWLQPGKLASFNASVDGTYKIFISVGT